MQFDSTARRVRAKAEISHRHSGGYACAMCRNDERDLAFSILVRSYGKDDKFDSGFVPLSAMKDIILGCFPLCTVCAPSCPKCGLPIATQRVLAFGLGKGANLGEGMCQHRGLREFVRSLIGKATKSH